MDFSESQVEKHLRHCGYVDIVYEPNGNVPPDFLVDGRIAIEVRRLNQNYLIDEETRGLEEVAIPLQMSIEKLAASLGSTTSGENWYLFYRFARPVENWRTLGPKLRRALVTFRASPLKQAACIFKEGTFELEVFKKSTGGTNTFVLGGYSDIQSGGWLLAEMRSNIQFCVAEKTRKTSGIRGKYPEWWLALVDHIGYGLDEFNRALFREKVSIEHNWDKIVLIDPRDATRSFVI